MDKAEQVFQKLAQSFKGFIADKENISDDKVNKLKERGYKAVSGEQYGKVKGEKMHQGLENQISKIKSKADSSTQTSASIGSILGAGVGGAASYTDIAEKLPKKARPAIIGGSALAGGLTGFGLGKKKEDEIEQKAKEYREQGTNKIDQMKDVYSVSDDKRFFIKKENR